MAEIKFTQLPAGAVPTDADILASVQNISTTPISVQITFEQIASWIENKSFDSLNATTFFGVNTGGNDVFSARVDSEAYPRFYIIDNGQLTWSQGTSIAFDARLFRPNASPNTLQIDNGTGGNADLIVTRNITCNTLNANLLNAPIPSQIDANKTYTYQSSVGTKTLRLASNSAVLTSQNVVVDNNTLTAGIINFASAGVIPSLSDTSVYLVREINGRFSGVSSYLQGTSLVPGQFNKVNFDKSGIATGNYQIDIWLLETAIPINLNNLNYFGVNPYLDVNFSSVNGITRDGNNAIVTVGHIIQNASGTSLPNRSFLKFTGTGVSVSDGISGETLVTINGNGDVIGPVSSTTRSIAFFSDTTGKLLNYSPWIFAGTNAERLYSPNNGSLQFLEHTSNSDIILSGLSGDTNQRMAINNSGLHKWSSGSSAYDLSLYRSAASTLKIDNNAGGGATLDLSNGTLSTRNVNATTFFGVNTGGNDVFSARVNTEAYPRFYIIDNGQVTWSQGTSIAFDVRLFRPDSTPNTLQIDDGAGGDANLIVTGDLTVDNVNLTAGGAINAVNIANAEMILAGYTGQPNFRYTLDREGLQKYSDGTASGYDLSLERAGVATLQLKRFDTNGAATLDTTGGTFIGNILRSSITDAALTLSTTGSAGGANIVLDPGANAEIIFRNSNQNIARISAAGLRMEDYVTPFSSSPIMINMGNSLSNLIGQMPKLLIRYTGSLTYGIGVSGAGIGASGSQMDYIVPPAAIHSFYLGSGRKVDVNANGLSVYSTANQLVLGAEGGTTTTITSPAPAASRVYTIPDAGGAASFVMTASNQTISGTKKFSSGVAVSATINQIVLGTTNTITITAPAPSASRVYTIPDVGGASSFILSAGNQTFTGAKSFAVGISIFDTSNQFILGTTNTTTITVPTPAASRTYTVPDAGGAASFVMTAGNQTIAGTKTFSATVLAPSINEQSVNAGVTIQGATICRTNGIMVGGSHTISGTRNAIIGGASCSITAGTDCVLVGSNMAINSSVNNSIGIGNYINVNATGAVGIADNSTTTNLTLGNNAISTRFAGGYFFWSNSAMNLGVQLAASGTSWTAASDVRKKKDIVDIDCKDVYAKVKKLPVITYKYKDDDSEQIRLGTSANEFNDLFGDEYIEKNIDKDGYNLISSADVTYVLLATVKELQNKVENLENTLH